MKSIITVKQHGSFRRTSRFMKKALRQDYLKVLDDYGQLGVQLLADHTPTASGETAAAWSYKILPGDGMIRLAWYNSHENDGVNVAILIIYGHAVQNGSYVEGNDFVTPAMRPLLDELAKRAWREVTK